MWGEAEVPPDGMQLGGQGIDLTGQAALGSSRALIPEVCF